MARFLTERDYERIQGMLRWWDQNKTRIGHHRRRYPIASIGGGGIVSSDTKIFEVLAAATGNSLYNCIEKTIDATKWDYTDGSDKFINLDPEWMYGPIYEQGDFVICNDVRYECIYQHVDQQPPNATYWAVASIEILNLLENNPVDSDYVPALAKGDRLTAQQLQNDEEHDCWVGRSLMPLVRLAKTTEAATINDYIICNLIGNDGVEITTGLGSSIEVYGNISGGSVLDEALRVLEDDADIFVWNRNGKWYAVEGFQTIDPAHFQFGTEEDAGKLQDKLDSCEPL